LKFFNQCKKKNMRKKSIYDDVVKSF